MMKEEAAGGRITISVALAVYAYAALTLALPFVADANPPLGVFLAAWLGGSVIAGAAVPYRWMFAIPGIAFMVLVFVMLRGYTDSKFLSDSLSSFALLTLLIGQCVGLAIGYTVILVVRSLKVND